MSWRTARRICRPTARRRRKAQWRKAVDAVAGGIERASAC
ncbi:hypothetical protein I553_2657 [Mycobacterium xenopi 4042]|uniref:Uncharacterized protein n=1 Tax=Mycobacterium xenopi 4042 TaxID=1299334 RepID=X8BK56_MYCXE|nr:hypothetical protein I553_2657 [Mycobacterium xenopi 4042]